MEYVKICSKWCFLLGVAAFSLIFIGMPTYDAWKTRLIMSRVILEESARNRSGLMKKEVIERIEKAVQAEKIKTIPPDTILVAREDGEWVATAEYRVEKRLTRMFSIELEYSLASNNEMLWK